MQSRIRVIASLSSETVKFHTLILDDKVRSEFYDFKINMSELCFDELVLLERQLEKISKNEDGAEPRFFKKENEAERIWLPTPEAFNSLEADPKDYGLRLYCVFLKHNCVVLLNGNKKQYKEVQNCGQCFPHFVMANKIAKALYKAIALNEIEISEEGYLLMDDDYKLII